MGILRDGLRFRVLHGPTAHQEDENRSAQCGTVEEPVPGRGRTKVAQYVEVARAHSAHVLPHKCWVTKEMSLFLTP
jgi:hypothetical protein